MHTDPAPWDDIAEALASPPVLTEEQALDLVEVIPDDTQAVLVSYRDPDAVERYIGLLRAAMRSRVRALLLAQAEQRLDIGAGRLTPAVVAPEVRLAADIADTLAGIAGAMGVGVEEAREYAAELLREVTDVKAVGTTSHRFPDGHGADIMVAVTQDSRPTVNADEVRDVLAEYLTITQGPSLAPSTEHLFAILGLEDEDAEHSDTVAAVRDVAVDAYHEGIDAGIGAVLGLLTPTWKVTAIKALASDLAAIPDEAAQVLAIRLEQAQGRTLVGEPRPKITRVDAPKRGRA